MRLVWGLAIAIVLLTPLALSHPATVAPGSFRILHALTLGLGSTGGWLYLLMANSANALTAGERALFDDALADPIGLLELPEISSELLGRLAVRRIGPIVGVHATDVPNDTALAAAALTTGPVFADDLRNVTTFARVRNGDDADLQRDDIDALMGRGDRR